MAQYDRSTAAQSGTIVGSAEFDEGLRKYMLGVYNYMVVGLLITGVVAYFLAQAATTGAPAAGTVMLREGLYLNSLGQALWLSPLRWVLMFSPLAFMLVFQMGFNRFSPMMTQILFFSFATLFGVCLSSIFVIYTSASIAKVLFITAAMFGAMSIWGYTTKRSLANMGSFLMMGMVGLLIAIVVNLFLGSSMLSFIISIVGVIVFTLMVAYDTQAIKEQYLAGISGDAATKGSVLGAFHLYISFIMIFQFLLSLLGQQE